MADHKSVPGKAAKVESSGFSPCKVKGCKHNPAKFGFCSEHFDHFKFGLINKSGEQCPDYEKKYDQFSAKKQKVA